VRPEFAEIFNENNIQQVIDSLDSLYAILDLNGAFLAVNRSLKKFVTEGAQYRNIELSTDIIGMNLFEVTRAGHFGDIIVTERMKKLEECIAEKAKKKFFDINRNEMMEGIFIPLLNAGNDVRLVLMKVDVVSSIKQSELRKNLLLFSNKEKIFLKEIVRHKTLSEIYLIDVSFPDFYNLNLTEASKRMIDRALLDNSGFFNRSAYVLRIDKKLKQHDIPSKDLLLCMKLFQLEEEDSTS